MFFVLKSKYDKMVSLYNEVYKNREEWMMKFYRQLDITSSAIYELDHYKKMVDECLPQFSDDDLRRLIQLCHPDKHDGKQMAQDMTAKLQAMRKSK